MRLPLTDSTLDLSPQEFAMMNKQTLATGSRWWLTRGLAVCLLVASPLGAWSQPSPAANGMQSSAERGVTVKVTPRALGAPGTPWEFAVVLDTHSADLSDDLANSATLTTDDGRTFKPTNWQGSPPGGHHREGVLVFDGPAPRPGAIELRIDRPGESAPRIFRWQL